MSYNGSGTFNINSTGQPVVTGTAISSTVFNAFTADIGTGLSTALTKDGQTVATARIPFAAGINSSLVTDATNTTTGSIITAGGVGVAKALFVGTTANIAGATTLASTLGVTGITTVAAGSAALPAIVSTTGTADTGLWFPAADTIAASTAGTERMRITSAGRVGIGTTSPDSRLTIEGTANNVNSEVKVTGTAVASGYLGSNSDGFNIGTDSYGIVFKTGVTGGGSVGATGTPRMNISVAGAVTIPGTLGVTGAVTLSTALPVASGGTGLTSIAHTVQVFTSGSGTYTTPANVKAIWVRAVGGGGGAGGSGSAGSPANGTGGGATTFSTLTASAGAGGPNSLTGGFTGGTAGGASGGDINQTGNPGTSAPGNTSPPLFQNFGCNGGASVLGGGGIAASNGAGGTGGAGTANSGGGGGGVGGNSVTYASAGGGGAGYVEKLIAAPAATYAYAVGAGGAGGASGTGGGTGGAGGSGVIIVTEYYV